MNERREPTISPLQINSEEAASKKSQADRQKSSATTPAHRPNSRHSTAPSSSRKTKPSSSPLAGVSFVVGLLALGGAGLIYLQLLNTQDVLNKTSASLTQAEGRIGSLEEKLALTGDESVQSMTVLQAKIKTNASEIRKLWGVAYDKNRNAIDANKVAIDQLVKTYKSSDGKLNKALVDLSADVSVLTELMNAQQGVLASVDKIASEQKKSMSVLSSKLSELDKSLTQKVLSNEEAIRAIDAFRLQVNRDLIRLKGG